jgi:hypothetical protein
MLPFNAGVITQIEKLIGIGRVLGQAGKFNTQNDLNAQHGKVID